MKFWIANVINRLQTGRIVDMRDRGYFAAGNVDALPQITGLFQRLSLLLAKLRSFFVGHRGNDQHVRAIVLLLDREPLRCFFSHHDRGERPKAFAILDFQIHHRLHLG